MMTNSANIAEIVALLAKVNVEELKRLVDAGVIGGGSVGEAAVVCEPGGAVSFGTESEPLRGQGGGGGVDVIGVEPAVGSGASITSSWADQVEAETESSQADSVVDGVPCASQAVRSSVVFGGFGAPVYATGGKSIGTMAAHVKTDAARGMRGELSKLGIKLPKAASWHLALVTHTAATIPEFFISGKSKLNTLAVLGDSALVAAVAASSLAVGQPLESVQRVRTTLLTDGSLARAFARSNFARYLNVASGVSLSHSKTGATALEALVGLVAYYRTPADVIVLAKCFRLIAV